MLLNIRSQVFWVSLSHLFQLLVEIVEDLIFLTAVPALNAKGVFPLKVQIGGVVINDNHPLQIPSNFAEVLQMTGLEQLATVSVEFERYSLLRVDFVQNPIRVRLGGSGEDADFEVFGEQLNELTGEGSDQEDSAIILDLVMDKSFV